MPEPPAALLPASDHPETLGVRYEVAVKLAKDGDVAGAVRLLEELVADQDRVVGANHHDSLVMRGMLADYRRSAGDAAGAVTGLTEVLERMARELGEDDPDTVVMRESSSTGRSKLLRNLARKKCDHERVPVLVDPAVPAGSLQGQRQPRIEVDDQLVLRPWHEGDASAVRTAFDCQEIQRWHVRRMDSLDEALAWIAAWKTRWDSEKDASWAITEDDQPIGQVGLRAISLFEGTAELSYWVLPAARGREVAVRAARALTQWTFELGLHRVVLQHSTANTASCRVAAKLGFPVEGTLRGALRHADGWHDSHVHASLRY